MKRWHKLGMLWAATAGGILMTGCLFDLGNHPGMTAAVGALTVLSGLALGNECSKRY